MPATLRIYCLTFNVATYGPAKTFGDDLRAFSELLDIGGGTTDGTPRNDIYVVGLQEVSSRLDKYFLDAFVSGEDEWTHAITSLLSEKGFLRLRTIRVLGTVLNVFVHSDHLLHIRGVETQYLRLSIGGYVGLKAAVALRLKLYGVTLCFVNTHLSAHDHNFKLRVDEYNRIVENVVFNNKDTPNILYHDYIVWCGDLNFRLEENSFTADEICRLAQEKQFATLLEKDQLTIARTKAMAFHELQEQISPDFPPTYKFVIGTDDYDKKRRPAYCDRILSRCNQHNYENFQLNLDQLHYKSHPGVKLSDHRPVSAQFTLRHFRKEDDRESSNLSTYDPIIRFARPDNWQVGTDGKIRYDVEAGKGGFLSQWDWIALFKADFKALSEYVTFTWASTSRLTGVEKTATIMEEAISQPGRFVLVYFGEDHSVYGMSEIFEVVQHPEDFIEQAQEVFEYGEG